MKAKQLLPFALAIFWFFPLMGQSAFNVNNLAILVASSNTSSNTTVSVVEINKVDTFQLAIQTILIPDTGVDAIRVSGSATSTLYASNSNDGTLFCFTGHNSSTTAGNANTILPRGVVTMNNAGNVTLQTTYTGNSGSQTRCATTINNVDFYIADQAGQYTNGATLPSPTGNFRGIKTFGGDVYLGMASSVVTNIEVATTSALTGGLVTGLPGLTNHGNHQDFFLVSSGSNGPAFDILYITRTTSATAGTIAKFSLDSGVWVANGTHTGNFGGFNIAAEKSGTSNILYLTTGNGATSGNSVRRLVDAAGYNTTINIVSNDILFTTATGTTIKGIAFAPVPPQVSTPVVTLADNGTQVAAGMVSQGANSHVLSSFIVNVGVADDTLNSFSFNTMGSFTAGDITAFYLFTNTTNAFPGGTPLTSVSSTSLSSGAGIAFTGLTQACLIGTRYFWVTADIASAATASNTVGVPALDSTHFSFALGTVSGIITAGGLQTIQSIVPVINLSPSTALAFGHVTVGQASVSKSYLVTGTNLTNNLLVVAPAGFEVAANITGPYDNTLVINHIGGTLIDSVHVRFIPDSVMAYMGVLEHVTPGISSVNLPVSGYGIAPNNQTLVHYWNFNNNASLTDLLTPTYTQVTGAAITHVPGGTSNINLSGGTGQNFNVENLNARFTDPSGTHLRFDNPIGGELVFELPTTGYEKPTVRFATRRSGSGAGLQYWSYRIDTTNTYYPFDTIMVYDADPLLRMLDFDGLTGVDDNPWFAVKVAFAQGGGGTAGNNRFDNFTLDADPLALLPAITASSLSLPFFTQTIGIPSPEETLTVSGTNLTDDIMVYAPANYEISLTSGAGFGNTLTLLHVSGTVAATPIYVRLNAPVVGTYSGNIVISTPGANTVNVSLDGACQNIIVPLPLIYYWHFNNLNTSAGDVKEIEADYSILPGVIALMTYTGGQLGDRDIDEYTPGSTLNLQMGELAGKAARVRNPSASRSLLFEMPTSGKKDLLFEYAVHRSNNGQLSHEIHYSIDTVNYIQTGLSQTLFNIATDYTLISVDFAGIAAVENNPHFRIRITFIGNNTGPDGNNRLDNITLKGHTTVGLTNPLVANPEPLAVYPNPVLGYGWLHFNKQISGILFDSYGRSVAEIRETDRVSSEGLAPGLYVFRTYQGETVKILVNN